MLCCALFIEIYKCVEKKRPRNETFPLAYIKRMEESNIATVWDFNAGAYTRSILSYRHHITHIPVVEKEGKEGVFFFKAQFNRGAHPPARLLFTHTRSASTVRCKHEASIAWLKTLGRHEKWYSLVVVQF